MAPLSAATVTAALAAANPGLLGVHGIAARRHAGKAVGAAVVARRGADDAAVGRQQLELHPRQRLPAGGAGDTFDRAGGRRGERSAGGQGGNPDGGGHGDKKTTVENVGGSGSGAAALHKKISVPRDRQSRPACAQDDKAESAVDLRPGGERGCGREDRAPKRAAAPPSGSGAAAIASIGMIGDGMFGSAALPAT